LILALFTAPHHLDLRHEGELLHKKLIISVRHCIVDSCVGVQDHLFVYLLSGLVEFGTPLNLVALPGLASSGCLDLGLTSLVAPTALERGLFVDFTVRDFNFPRRGKFLF